MGEKIDKNDARQGETSGKMRYVLIISIVLAVIALALVGFNAGG